MNSYTNCKLIMQDGPLPAETFELTQSKTVIGRAPSADIVLSFPAVSGRHVLIIQEAGQYFIEDLNSSNGTFINGQRLTGRKPLNPNDEIHLGQSIILHFEAPFVDRTMLQQPPEDATMLEQDIPLASGAAPFVAATSDVATSDVDQEASTVVAPQTPVEKAPFVPPPGGETMIFEDFAEAAATSPPQLKVAISGDPPQVYRLTAEQITIGRAETNNIVVPSKIVSRNHAILQRLPDGGYQIVPFKEAGNPVLFEGRPLLNSKRLHHEDKLRIGGLDPGSMVTITFLSPRDASATTSASSIQFGEKTLIGIGRDPSNEVVVDSPIVSRYHAEVERVGSRYRVTDLQSANGTFVNNERIDDSFWLKPDDTIRVGPYRFVMGLDQLAQYDERGDLRIEAVNLNKWVRKDLNILQNISLVFQPREFVVVVGQSGGGKSTLVDAIAGYRPATDGEVSVNDINVYQNFDAIRDEIGYVPQRDIIHMELTIGQALDYAAQLRMPPDTTKAERRQRVDDVLEDLDLAHRKDVQISGLSGGQQKRVSIGVELLTKPGLFFLDEPTSGLDPGTETSFMQLMRRLADQGRTIVLITHATKNVMLADKVVFLARGGYLAWFGPPEDALAYFDKYRSERERRSGKIEFDDIYNILGDSTKGSATDWADRYHQSPAYDKYISQPLHEKDRAPTGQYSVPAAAPGPKRKRQVSSWRQFLILSSRNIKILTRDRFSLALMLAAPPIVSLLDVILALVLGRDPFNFFDGSMPNVMITLFLLTVYGVMVGGLAQMREIVKEQDVYKRERLVNLRLFPYVMSKIWVAALLAVYASIVYMVVHYIAFDMPGGAFEFVLMLISLTLATMAGMMLGLFASALAPNANAAPLIVVLFMLPQIVLGGALVPLPEFVTAPISTRWAFQAFMGISGVGSDVAADACWTVLDTEAQKQLSLDEKNENCLCMGTNALHEDSCNYPGLGAFYNSSVDEPQPPEFNEPAPVRPVEPARPELPPQPEQPEDQSDLKAMAQWQEDIGTWQEEVEAIQSAYEVELETYRAELQVFEAEVSAYQDQVVESERARVNWRIAQEASILPAEELIRQFYPGFGWTYVDKTDSGAYWSMLVKTWAAQLLIITVLFFGIMILQKRKDVVR